MSNHEKGSCLFLPQDKFKYTSGLAPDVSRPSLVFNNLTTCPFVGPCCTSFLAGNFIHFSPHKKLIN